MFHCGEVYVCVGGGGGGGGGGGVGEWGVGRLCGIYRGVMCVGKERGENVKSIKQLPIAVTMQASRLNTSTNYFKSKLKSMKHCHIWW